MRALAFKTLLAASALAACHRAPEELAPPSGAASVTSVSSARAASTPPPAAKPIVPGCPDDPEPNLRPLPTTTLTIKGFDTKPLSVDAEIARGDHDTQRGLMYRTQMPEMHGMIFELDTSDHMFWMHNTCIPLDLVYIARGQIVGIVESAPILNDDPRGVGKLSDEVLELNAGFCKTHGVKVGQHVTRAGESG
jgi:uncharacterized membrane protein (UPF0127 family)